MTTLFDQYFENVDVEKIEKCKKGVHKAIESVYQQILSLEESVFSYETLVRPLIRCYAQNETDMNFLSYLQLFHPSEELRDAASDALTYLQPFLTEQYTQPGLAPRYRAYHDGAAYASERGALSEEERLFLDMLLRDFERLGGFLPAAQRPRLLALNADLAALKSRYRANLGACKESIELSAAELGGLPRLWDEFEALDAEKGRYRITLTGAATYYLLQYLHDRDARRRVWCASQREKGARNLPLLAEALRLRLEKAELFGAESFAHMRLQDMELQRPEKVAELLDELQRELRAPRAREIGRLVDFARAHAHALPEGAGLESWDMNYYRRALCDARWPVDAEQVRDHFGVDAVVAGTLRVYAELFAVRFERVPQRGAWHADVEAYAVHESGGGGGGGGALLGHLVLDVRARDGKFGGYGAWDFVTGCDERHLDPARLPPGGSLQGGRRLPCALLCCSFGQRLGFYEVIDYFHEFAHAMHTLLSRTEIAAFSGLLTHRDMVEAPAIMFEYVCQSPAVLSRLSAHVETGAPLPEALCDGLKQQKWWFSAIDTMWEVLLAKFDQRVHQKPLVEDTTELVNQLMIDVLGYHSPEPSFAHCAFPHIMGGYGGYEALYYGYLFARASAVQMYSAEFEGKTFEEMQQAAQKFRAVYMQPGCVPSGMELVKNFSGHEFSLDALMREIAKH